MLHPAWGRKYLRGMERLKWLFRFSGTVSRSEYLFWGVVLFALKYAIDLSLARAFSESWLPWEYFVPRRGVPLLDTDPASRQLFGLMWAIAVPFFWAGVALTVRRLRATGHAHGLVVMFFLPVVNLLLFTILCLLPEREREGGTPWAAPRVTAARLVGALTVTTVLGTAAVMAAVYLLRGYGWGLFIALPFVLGYTAVRLAGTTSRLQAFGVAMLAVFLVGFVLFGTAMEGLICLLMALPLAIPPALLGALLAAWPHWRPASAHAVVALMVPLLMGLETVTPAAVQTKPVVTSVVVNAPSEKVWNAVVAFPEIAPPDEWMFLAGVAYPTGARIEGRGSGAVRYCEFSTGAFVEPIQRWEEATVLAFSVTSQPPVLEELSPFEVSAPHLKAPLLRSHRGQFRLVRLPDGRTLLEGTTWYSLEMRPAVYWRGWSDYVIHRIHRRVLRHVKKQAEGPAG